MFQTENISHCSGSWGVFVSSDSTFGKSSGFMRLAYVFFHVFCNLLENSILFGSNYRNMLSLLNEFFHASIRGFGKWIFYCKSYKCDLYYCEPVHAVLMLLVQQNLHCKICKNMYHLLHPSWYCVLFLYGLFHDD